MIVGAVETQPGVMQVELLDISTSTIEQIYVPTNEYLSCWNGPVSLWWPWCIDWRRTSTPPDSWFPFDMDKQEQRRRIAREIEDTVYAYHLYPHMAMVPDYFLRYWDLAEAICDYLDVPFDKPKLASEYEVK